MVTRASRPPGFEMSYRPRESVYAVPLLERLPSFFYLFLAVCAVLLVVIGENSSSDSWLFDFVVVQDRGRLLGARAFSIVLSVGAVASVVRSNMRGIRVYGDGLEAREVAFGFWPRVRRYRWPQMELISLEAPSIVIQLWDGRRASLPRVEDQEALVSALEMVAVARDIPLRGGRGLDEIPEKISEDEDVG